MANSNLKWKCSECDSLNETAIDDFKKYVESSFPKFILVCSTCGFACSKKQATDILNNDDNNDYGRDKPLRDVSSNIPYGVFSFGTENEVWVDCRGEHLSRINFLIKYGVDPRINWEYRNGRKMKKIG